MNIETALEWMILAKEVLPDASPLTAEERNSINEFVWSYFDEVAIEC